MSSRLRAMLVAMQTRFLMLAKVGALSALAIVAASCAAPVREDQAEPRRDTEDAVRACPGSATLQGIDVSHWQGRIDWPAVAGSGKSFAIMKATEGTSYVDDTFAANWSGSASAGMIRGAYHYFHPSVDPVAQANRFADIMGPLSSGDLPPMLDLEDADRLSPAQVAQSTRRFLETLEARTGRRPMIYTGFYFWRDQVGDPPGFSGYPLVMAAYVSGCPMVPPSWGSFTMWQYTSSGRVPGIAGNVDLDLFNGDIDALRTLAGGPVPPPPVGCGIFGWGSAIGPGQSVASCSGRFSLVHQTDGNVVLYDNPIGVALWSSGTDGRSTDALVMQQDGNLVLYAPGGIPVWSSGTNGNLGPYLVVQDDGNVVIYRPGGVAVWATDTVQ